MLERLFQLNAHGTTVREADCLDMESIAIAQVCRANKKPFLIVRQIR